MRAALKGSIETFQLLREPNLVFLVLLHQARSRLIFHLLLRRPVILLTHFAHLAGLSRVIREFRGLATVLCLGNPCIYPAFGHVRVSSDIFQPAWMIGLRRILPNH